MATTTADHDTAARQLLELRETANRIHHENARRPSDGPDRLTGEHVDAALEAMRATHAACEAFRLRFYPRAGRIVAAGGLVLAAPPSGSRGRTVYDRATATAGTQA